MFKRFLLGFVLSFWFVSVYSQQIAFTYSDSIKVIINNDTLKNPFSGGFQSPQFSSSDFNADGYKDLFVFDRYDNRIQVFLFSPSLNRFILERKISTKFPQLLFWAVLHDYNCDGKEDIFTSNSSGIRVYKNTSTSTSISFVQTYNQLIPQNGPLDVPSMDIPVISDIDNDGDLDFLAFDFAGSFVIFFKNQQVEESLPCDSIKLIRENGCWGQFEENNFNSTISLNVSCKTSDYNSSEQTLHVGSTLLAFDSDGDNDKDILVGDITSTGLTFLRNDGTVSAAEMGFQNGNFPSSNPINIYAFPASYFLDVDNDGKRDLIVCTNDPSEAGARNYEQIWFYKNTGTDSSPIFSFQQTDFLADQSIDVGAGAAPHFLDLDGDSDLDLLIGNYAYRKSPSDTKCGLTQFLNIGTNQNPVFELDTIIYLTTSTFSPLSVVPTSGDLDGDGDLDLLLGELNGGLIYYENTAGVGNKAIFNHITNSYSAIDVGNNSTPCLVDLDNDSDLDLLIGERAGNINYYKNEGTTSVPNFVFQTDSLGKIDTRNGSFAGYSAPTVADINNNDSLDLIVGSSNGKVAIFSDFMLSSNLKFTENTNTLYFDNQLVEFKTSKRIIPAIYNSNSDYPSLFLGLYKGGLEYFKNISYLHNLKAKESFEIVNELVIYPNPFSEEFIIQTEEIIQVKITDVVGKTVLEKSLHEKNPIINTSTFNEGIYFIQIKSSKQLYSSKILKIVD